VAPGEGSATGALEAPSTDGQDGLRFRRWALRLGFLPLVVGTLIYVGWRFTHRPGLMMLGMVWIGVGTLLVLGGAGA